jgi:hypothetical protein
MTNFSEKRDFLRMAIDCQLSFAKKGETQSLEGHVVNLSSKGILFTATDKYEVGEQLDIVLTPANSPSAPLEARVEIIRATYNGSVYELACEITGNK